MALELVLLESVFSVLNSYLYNNMAPELVLLLV